MGAGSGVGAEVGAQAGAQAGAGMGAQARSGDGEADATRQTRRTVPSRWTRGCSSGVVWMINFVLACLLCSAPIILLMLWKRYYAGLVIGNIVFVFVYTSYQVQAMLGPAGWVALYPINESYVVRWMLPTVVFTLSALSGVRVWVVWLLMSGALWWLVLCLFHRLLVHIGFNQTYALIGSLLPLLTFASAYHQRHMMNADALLFLIVLGTTWTYYKWRHDHKPRGLLLIPLLVVLAAVVSFPVPLDKPRILYLPADVFELLASGGVYWIFMGVALFRYREQIPNFVRVNRIFLLVVGVVMVIAVDWDRWFVLSAFLWVPLVLVALQNTLKGKGDFNA